jgi:hypothetical protein
MKLKHFAILAILGSALALPVAAQTGVGQGMGPGSGIGPGAGMGPGGGAGQGGGMGPGGGKGMRFNQDNTPGWALMSAEERTAHRNQMRAAKSYEECKTLQAAHHSAMTVRAQEKGVTLPAPRANVCDRMQARGFFK